MSFEQRIRQQQAAADEEERKKAAQARQLEQAAETRKLEILSSPEWRLMRSVIHHPEVWKALKRFFDTPENKPNLYTPIVTKRKSGIKGLLGATESIAVDDRPLFERCITITEEPFPNARTLLGRIELVLYYDYSENYEVEPPVGGSKELHIRCEYDTERGLSMCSGRKSYDMGTQFTNINDLLDCLVVRFVGEYPDAIIYDNSEMDTTEANELIVGA